MGTIIMPVYRKYSKRGATKGPECNCEYCQTVKFQNSMVKRTPPKGKLKLVKGQSKTTRQRVKVTYKTQYWYQYAWEKIQAFIGIKTP